MKLLLIFSCSLIIASCSHVIDTTPDVGKLNYRRGIVIDKKVIYIISQKDIEKRVVDPTTGGDSVEYFPYKEMEPGLRKVLFNVFGKAERLSVMPDIKELKENKIHHVFVPNLETRASSDSNFTWPPTDFDLSFSVSALNQDGKLDWSKSYKTIGKATSDEWRRNHGHAAKVAYEKIFQEFTDDLQSLGIFNKK